MATKGGSESSEGARASSRTPLRRSVIDHHVELWALIDSTATEATSRYLGHAVALFGDEAEAREALADVLADEPGWREAFSMERVAAIELSPN
jgi:hypothetical protein